MNLKKILDNFDREEIKMNMKEFYGKCRFVDDSTSIVDFEEYYAMCEKLVGYIYSNFAGICLFVENAETYKTSILENIDKMLSTSIIDDEDNVLKKETINEVLAFDKIDNNLSVQNPFIYKCFNDAILKEQKNIKDFDITSIINENLGKLKKLQNIFYESELSALKDNVENELEVIIDIKNKIKDSTEQDEIQEAIRLFYDLWNDTPLDKNPISLFEVEQIIDSTDYKPFPQGLYLYAEIHKHYTNHILDEYTISVWASYLEDIEKFRYDIEEETDENGKTQIFILFCTNNQQEMEDWVDKQQKYILQRYGLHCNIELNY